MQSTGQHAAGERARRLRCASACLMCWLLPSCLRLGYELVSEAKPDPFAGLPPTALEAAGIAPDAGAAAALPRAPERSEFPPAPTWSRPSSGSARHDLPTGGYTPGPTGLPGDSPDGGSSAPQACLLSGNEGVVNGFDSPASGLQARGPGAPQLSWTGSTGNPDPGAMVFDNAGGGELYYPGSLGDLRGRTLSLNVQVAVGSGARLRLFLESGPQRRRARAPFSSPPLGQWDCARLDPEAPASADNGFDPGDIVGAGLEIEASAQVRVYVDQIAY